MQDDFFSRPDQPNRGVAARGVFWLGMSQVLRVGISFVSIATVSRLLSPDDFGLIASVGPVLGIAGLIQDIGMSQAMIQADHMTEARANAMFWLSVFTGVIVALLLAVLAIPVSRFFGRGELVGVMLAYSSLPILGSLQLQHGAVLNRRLMFGRLAAIDAISAVVGFVVALACAFTLRSYWALVYSVLAAAAAWLVGAWIACRWRPWAFTCDRKLLGLVRFGSSVSGYNILNFITSNADNVIIGRFLGAEPLGLYDRAYRLLMFPIQQISSPIGRVMIPLLSGAIDDKTRYRNAYVEAVSLVLLATQPAIVVATACSSSLILVLIGPNWAPVADIYFWLGICSLHQIFTGTTSWLLLSQSRSRDLLHVSGYSAVTSTIAFLVGLHWGAVGVAASYTITDYILRVPVIWHISGRTGPVSAGDLCRTFIPHAIASIFCFIVLYTLGVPRLQLGFSGLLLTGVATQAAYTAILLVFPSKRTLIITNFRWGMARIAR